MSSKKCNNETKKINECKAEIILDRIFRLIYIGIMKLKGFLKKHKLKPTPWAKKKGISPSIISRHLNGVTGMSKKNALEIEQATDGEVTVLELLYPEIY